MLQYLDSAPTGLGEIAHQTFMPTLTVMAISMQIILMAMKTLTMGTPTTKEEVFRTASYPGLLKLFLLGTSLSRRDPRILECQF